MAVTTGNIEHGTYGGYQHHRRLAKAGLEAGEPCGPCRKAMTEYMTDWRARNPGRHQRQQTVQGCRDRALRRLAELYPVAFERLYREERRALQPKAVAT